MRMNLAMSKIKVDGMEDLVISDLAVVNWKQEGDSQTVTIEFFCKNIDWDQIQRSTLMDEFSAAVKECLAAEASEIAHGRGWKPLVEEKPAVKENETTMGGMMMAARAANKFMLRRRKSFKPTTLSEVANMRETRYLAAVTKFNAIIEKREKKQKEKEEKEVKLSESTLAKRDPRRCHSSPPN